MIEDNSYQFYNIEPYVLVDEFSNTEQYIGTSKNDKDTALANWKIKRITKTGTVWKFGYPNGDQSFNYIWDNRFGYTYS